MPQGFIPTKVYFIRTQSPLQVIRNSPLSSVLGVRLPPSNDVLSSGTRTYIHFCVTPEHALGTLCTQGVPFMSLPPPASSVTLTSK